MQADEPRAGLAYPRIRTRYKLIASYIAVTLGALLLVNGIVLGTRFLLSGRLSLDRSGWSSYIAFEMACAAPIALLLGLWASHPLTRRLDLISGACHAWLRGDLKQRIADPVPDDLGQLAEQLDILAQHLEQDEQDLARLREYHARVTDQVRALAVDEERERLARELHDGVKQHLFSLSMTASAVRTHLETQLGTSLERSAEHARQSLPEMVQEVETTSKTVQRELTRLIENLRPGTLEEKGLATALNDYTLLFGAREHILTYLDVQGNDALLPPSVAESLYRVAQEALHNVARHARATRVDVQLQCLAEQATLTLSDNGIGFDINQPRRGLGLGNMQDRMVSIGGRLTIDSKAGSGTTVRAEVGLTRSLSLPAESTPQDKERPTPTIENWAWLGQRLVIPVGQTWPWLPADARHLRRPLVTPGQEPLNVRQGRGPLGLRREYLLQHSSPLARMRHHRWGYGWRFEGAAWALRYVHEPHPDVSSGYPVASSGSASRAVLLRNGQPLAATQRQGRLLNTWTEIVYDERGYRLSRARNSDPLTPVDSLQLTDQSGEELLSIEGGTALWIKLRRPLPLPLLATVIACVREEGTPAISPSRPAEQVP